MDFSDSFSPSGTQDQARLNIKNGNLQPKTPPFRNGGGGATAKYHRARFSNMATFKSRVMTFNGSKWPHRTRATPVDMAKAGLFYLGDSDRVMCFYCGGGLRDWNLNDEPWFEHCKWYPHCEFVQNEKGSDYVKRVCDQNPDQQRPTSTIPKTQTSFDVPPPTRHRVPVEQRLKEAKQNELYEEALKFGFEPEVVEAVVRRHIEDGNKMYSSLKVLVTDIQEYEATREIEATAESPESSVKADTAIDVDASAKNQPAGQLLMSAFPASKKLAIKRPSPPPQASTSNKEGEAEDDGVCKVCLDRNCDCVLMPCGHVCCCVQCASALRVCPICRSRMESIVKFYR